MSEMTWPFFYEKSSGFTYLGLAVAPATWYNIDSTNTMLVCRRKGGQNVTDRQDYRFILQIEPGRYASRGKREHTEPKTDFTKVC